MSGPSIKHFRPGQFLFHENEPATSVFLIQKGSVAIRKRKGNGFIELAKVYSNEIIGEMSYFDGRPRSAAAVAISEVDALELKFDGLDKIYSTVPTYIKTIVTSMADRLRRADDVIRRLEKSLVNEQGAEATKADEPSLADILALTSNFDAHGNESPPNGDSSGGPIPSDQDPPPDEGSAK